MKVYNAENHILGRLASYLAKEALLGEEIVVVNCEKAVITGNRPQIIAHYHEHWQRGHHRWGPFPARKPDRFVRRVIRGMLPFHKTSGREAFARVMCYIGLPEPFKKAQLETVEKAHLKKVPNLKYIFVEEVCRLLGAKWQQK